MTKYMIGIDECGAGSWAGDLIVSGVLAPETFSLYGLTDSKKLTKISRKNLINSIKSFNDIKYFIATYSSVEVDSFGLAKCLTSGYQKVFDELYNKDLDIEVIVDGNRVKPIENTMGVNIKSIIKADLLIPIVSAASILGKEYHDDLMRDVYDIKYPNYNFKSHVGYGTKEHSAAIDKFGICEIHRKSYKPIAKFIKDNDVGR